MLKIFWPPTFWGQTIPTFLRQRIILLSTIGKVWLSSVCWCPSAKPGNEVDSRIYVWWVKWRSSLKPFVDQSSCFLRRCRRPLVVVCALDRLSTSCFIPKIQAVKVAVKLRSRPKKVGFGPPICMERGYPRFWTCVFKLHLLPSMWLIVVEFRSASLEIS